MTVLKSQAPVHANVIQINCQLTLYKLFCYKMPVLMLHLMACQEPGYQTK